MDSGLQVLWHSSVPCGEMKAYAIEKVPSSGWELQMKSMLFGLSGSSPGGCILSGIYAGHSSILFSSSCNY